MKERKAPLLTRREAVERVSLLLGGTALVGHAALLAGCASPGRARQASFPSEHIALLDEIADTILPETSTPGAKAAGVGRFIAVMVRETYSDEDRRIFEDGLAAVDDECRRMHGVPFMSASASQRRSLLERLDAEQVAYMRTRAPDASAHYFRMIKELTLLGYFTSEIGYTQAMRYMETPGRFDPCVPCAPGEKAWAPHA